MKNNRQNSGITLIALIITIIVMLILVAVTVSVALDGGLFGKASNASNDTKEAVERESLQDFILGEMDVENGIIPGTFVKTYTDSDGKTWTVTAEEEEEDIEITLTNGTDVITKKLKGDLKISGVTLVQNGTPDDTPECIPGATFNEEGTLVTLTWEQLMLKENGERFGYSYNCISKTELLLDSETHVGPFSGCNTLISVTLPDSIVSVALASFANCRNLKNIVFSNNISTLKEYMISTSGVESVTLPNNLTTLQGESLAYASDLSSVTYRGTTYTSLSALKNALSENNVEFWDSDFDGINLEP